MHLYLFVLDIIIVHYLHGNNIKKYKFIKRQNGH